VPLTKQNSGPVFERIEPIRSCFSQGVVNLGALTRLTAGLRYKARGIAAGVESGSQFRGPLFGAMPHHIASAHRQSLYIGRAGMAFPDHLSVFRTVRSGNCVMPRSPQSMKPKHLTPALNRSGTACISSRSAQVSQNMRGRPWV